MNFSELENGKIQRDRNKCIIFSTTPSHLPKKFLIQWSLFLTSVTSPKLNAAALQANFIIPKFNQRMRIPNQKILFFFQKLTQKSNLLSPISAFYIF